jgi:D-serine deaminase-like pyridoxal phosphate-dependent protein
VTVTPRLVLDRRRLDANIAGMAARVRELDGALRPHVKTHKSPEIMRRQVAAGAAGITVATVHEATVMIAAGAADVLVAYPPVGPERLAALAELSGRARLTVTCSEPAHLDALADLDVGVYWEIDVGAGRLGTPPGGPTAEALAGIGSRLRGIMAFSGHAYGTGGGEELGPVAAAEADALRATATALRERGIDPGVLSVGSTPLAGVALPGAATEYRFGNYVFKDATQVGLGAASVDECALTVEATVVGRPDARRVILDAGSKALAAERMASVTDGFGIVRGHAGLRVAQLYEEHAICHTSGPCALAVGDRVHVIPNHACTCANLHARYAVVEHGSLVDEWPVAARGWEAARPASA